MARTGGCLRGSRCIAACRCEPYVGCIWESETLSCRLDLSRERETLSGAVSGGESV